MTNIIVQVLGETEINFHSNYFKSLKVQLLIVTLQEYNFTNVSCINGCVYVSNIICFGGHCFYMNENTMEIIFLLKVYHTPKCWHCLHAVHTAHICYMKPRNTNYSGWSLAVKCYMKPTTFFHACIP